jgi:hypothetical protein
LPFRTVGSFSRLCWFLSIPTASFQTPKQNCHLGQSVPQVLVHSHGVGSTPNIIAYSGQLWSPVQHARSCRPPQCVGQRVQIWGDVNVKSYCTSTAWHWHRVRECRRIRHEVRYDEWRMWKKERTATSTVPTAISWISSLHLPFSTFACDQDQGYDRWYCRCDVKSCISCGKHNNNFERNTMHSMRAMSRQSHHARIDSCVMWLSRQAKRHAKHALEDPRAISKQSMIFTIRTTLWRATVAQHSKLIGRR